LAPTTLWASNDSPESLFDLLEAELTHLGLSLMTRFQTDQIPLVTASKLLDLARLTGQDLNLHLRRTGEDSPKTELTRCATYTTGPKKSVSRALLSRGFEGGYGPHRPPPKRCGPLV
jgi:hypothetical protein